MSAATRADLLASVEGWAYTNTATTDDPPVVVNPNASLLSLIAWATAQLEQANVMAEVVGCATHGGGMDTAEFSGAIRHFTGQAEQVLKAALARLEGGEAPALAEGGAP